MIKLLRSWYMDLEHFAVCSNCGSEYLFHSQRLEGCADHVSVFCGTCGQEIGRVRADIGGDIRLNRMELVG